MPQERGGGPPRRGRDPAYDVAALRLYAGAEVRVCLADGATWMGWLRTDLLTDRSLSVYVRGRGGQGATLYIDQIAEIVRLPFSPE